MAFGMTNAPGAIKQDIVSVGGTLSIYAEAIEGTDDEFCLVISTGEPEEGAGEGEEQGNDESGGEEQGEGE